MGYGERSAVAFATWELYQSGDNRRYLYALWHIVSDWWMESQALQGLGHSALS